MQGDLLAGINQDQTKPNAETITLQGAGDTDLLQYYGNVFAESAGGWYQQMVEQFPWQQDTMVIAGQEKRIPRLQIWMGDNKLNYQYSGIRMTAMPWLAPVDVVKRHVEELTGYRFNSALLNFYRHGNDSVAWHADDEPELDSTTPIASVSLGQTRRFSIKPKKMRTRSIEQQGLPAVRTRQIDLQNGSLLVMMPGVQQRWQHAVLKQPNVEGGRINLTFRRINA